MMQNSIYGKQLPQKLSRALLQHASEYYDCDIEQLKHQVQAHLSKLESALAYNEFLDINIAKNLVGVISELLDQFEVFDDKEKALIFGAAQYFVHDKDMQSDTTSVLGLDDDVLVLNYVLAEIGRSDLVVEL
jgi:uncharacterized membrane protein YkvA (DUF1232 family)